MDMCSLDILSSDECCVITSVDRSNATCNIVVAIDPQYLCMDPAGLLLYCIKPRSRHEIDDYLRGCNVPKKRNAYMKALLGAGFIKMTRQHSPTSSLQRYYTDLEAMAK